MTFLKSLKSLSLSFPAYSIVASSLGSDSLEGCMIGFELKMGSLESVSFDSSEDQKE